MWIKAENKKAVSGLLVKDLPALDLQGSDLKIIVTFPYSILLTHACDISEFYECLKKKTAETRGNVDRQTITQMIFCPAFDKDLFSNGTHLQEQYGYQMETIYEKEMIKITKNQVIRYQYLKGPTPEIPDFILDFRHCFTLPAMFLMKYLEDSDAERYLLNHIHYTCLADRFAHYLQRVAIP